MEDNVLHIHILGHIRFTHIRRVQKQERKR